MYYIRIFILSLFSCFIFSYEVGDQVSYWDQLNHYDICYGAIEHGFEPDGTLSFSDFNGSSSDFHVFMIDLTAQW